MEWTVCLGNKNPLTGAPRQRNELAFDPEGSPHDLYRYVYLATPDEAYYVGLDLACAMHPQMLLCDAINWQSLTRERGVSLRLYREVKYGYKSLKRIGLILFQDERTPDCRCPRAT